MATSLDLIHEDLLFYKELRKYAFPNIPRKIDKWNKKLIKNGIIQIETLLEYAISIIGNIKHTPVQGCDFDDWSDAKKITSSFRCHDLNKGIWRNRYVIGDTKNKKGTLRAMGLNRVLTENTGIATFDYFAIPNIIYNGQHSVPIELDYFSKYFNMNNPPTPLGLPYGKYAPYKVKDFIEMATAKYNHLGIRIC